MFSQRFVVAPLACLAFCLLALTPSTVAAQSIVDIAVENEDFSTLVELVVTADLAETLAGEGPFTVFAPTDDAFANLVPFAAEAIERNPALLTDILLYHVVPGEVLAEDVLASESLETVQGEMLSVSLMDEQPMIDSANIVAVDVMAENGVIHVIDEVLVPEVVYQDALIQIRDALAALLAVLEAQLAHTSSSYGYGS